MLFIPLFFNPALHASSSHHFLDWSSSSPNALLSTIVPSFTSVQLLDINTGSMLWQLDAGGLVQGACCASPHHVLVCVGPGTLQLRDTRTQGSTCSSNSELSSLSPSAANEDQYSIAVSSLTHQAATISSSTGVVSLYDLRSTFKQPMVTISIQPNNRAYPQRPHLQVMSIDPYKLPVFVCITSSHQECQIYSQCQVSHTCPYFPTLTLSLRSRSWCVSIFH